jgi:WD40 repeat protein
MAIAEPGGWLAAGMDSGEVAIISVDTRKEQRRLRLAPGTPVSHLTASADGRWLAVVQGTSLHVFDSGSWGEVASRTYEQAVSGAAFIAGDLLVAVTGTNVVVLQAGDWRERLRLGHDAKITGVNVSPDRRQLATHTYRLEGHRPVIGTRVFDLTNGNEPAPVPEVSSWPAVELGESDERVSADGGRKVVASGSVATLSDAASGRTIGDFDQGSEINAVRFFPAREPQWLVTAGDDGTLAVWPMRTDDLVRQACARLHAMFDPQALKKLITDAHAEGSCE